MKIGRHPDCDIVVEAGAVSRFHAEINRHGEEWAVVDSGSRNGTFVNGQLLSRQHILGQGDRIRISDVELVYHGDAAPGFAGGGGEMTFEGNSFGIVMVDDEETQQIAGSKIEFRSSEEGLRMSATPEAKLAALMRINSNLTGAITLDEVLPKVLESLFEIFPSADRGFVVMQDSDGGLIPQWVKTRKQNDDTETIRISRTIIRKTMESGETILSLDAMDDSRFDSSESIADFSIRSMMCAPLNETDGKAIGALQIDSTQGRGQFRDEDIDLLTGVAAQISVVITNARMHEQAMRQQEVEQDLRLATDVQAAFLPKVAPRIETYALESFYQAANHIGGDYYDYIELGDGRLAVIVADVVGHGVAAAMYMAKLAFETRFFLAAESNLARAIERLNDRMCELNVERFVTYLLIVIDPTTDAMSIVNAGHMAPIIRIGADGSIIEPGEDESGLPIAIAEGMDYEVTITPFRKGDVAVMYTDGVNEAMDAEDEEWGIEPLRSVIASAAEKSSGENVTTVVKEQIVEQVFAHIGAAAQFDDMCLVVIQRTDEPHPGNTGDTDIQLPTSDDEKPMTGPLAETLT